MSIPFHCPHCDAFTEVDERHVGQTGPCAVCGKTVTIPTVVPPDTPKKQPTRHSMLWMISLAVVGVITLSLILFGGLLAAVFVPTVIPQAVGPPDACRNNVSRIAAAMLAYQEAHGTLPPACLLDKTGAPAHSWRVLILPYLGRQDLYGRYRFEEPWNSQHNQDLVSEMPSVYGCPSSAATEFGETSYMVLSGKGLAFHRGQRSVTTAFSDGAENTILLVEVLDAQVAWTNPKDIDAASVAWTIDRDPKGMGSNHRTGTHVAMADGRVYRYTRLIPSGQLHALATTDGNESADPSDWSE